MVRKNLLTINIEKTKWMPFAIYKNFLPQFNVIKINSYNFAVEKVSTIKYLGIYLDNHMKWDHHVNQSVVKLRKLYYLFRTAKQFLDLKHLKILYHGLAGSNIHYGITGWGGIYKTNLYPLVIAQKTIIKIIMNKPYTYPTEALFNESGLLNIRQIYIKKTLIKYHLREVLYIKHNYSTRQITNMNVVTKIANKSIGTRFLSYLAPRFYNLLPNCFHNIRSKSKFKHSIHTYLLNCNMQLFYNIFGD